MLKECFFTEKRYGQEYNCKSIPKPYRENYSNHNQCNLYYENDQEIIIAEGNNCDDARPNDIL